MSSTEIRKEVDALASRCAVEGRPFLSDLIMSQEIVEAVQFANEHAPLPQEAQASLLIVAAELLRRGVERV